MTTPSLYKRRYGVFSKILVRLDGTPEAAVALMPPLTVVKTTDAPAHLLTVIDTEASVADHARIPADLEGVAADLRSHGPQVDMVVRRSTRPAEIVAAAIERGAAVNMDVIVMPGPGAVTFPSHTSTA